MKRLFYKTRQGAVNQRFTVIHINNFNNNPCLNYNVDGVDVEVSVQGKDLGVINHIVILSTQLYTEQIKARISKANRSFLKCNPYL